MPTDVTDSAAFTSPVRVPVDTEGATSASLLGTFAQALANRTRYLQNLTEVAGVVRRRSVASIAALKAIGAGSRADRDVVFVEGYGDFFFAAAASDATAEPWIVVPTAGAGRWYHTLLTIQAASPGIATLNSTGHLIQPVTNQVVGVGFTESSSDTTTTAASYVDNGTSDITLTCAIGDLMIMHASCTVGISPAFQQVYTRLAVDDGTAGAIVASTRETQFIAGSYLMGETSSTWMRTIAHAGSRVARIQLKTGGSGTAHMYTFQFCVVVIRP